VQDGGSLLLLLWLGCGLIGLIRILSKGYFTCGCILWLLFGWSVVTLAIALGPVTLLVSMLLQENE
jgi:hypothetical protein